MRKLFVLGLALMVAVCTSPMSYAVPVVIDSETVGISIVLTGDPFVDVVTSDAAALTWTGVTLGVTGWKAADNHLEVTYLLPAGGGISMNTQNADDAVGLIGATDDQALPMAWRIVNQDSEVSADIYEYVYSEVDDAVDYNEDGDMLDYIGKLTHAAVEPAWADVYATWVWMLDGPVSEMSAADPPNVTYSSPITVSGIQHAEMSWGTWGGSPDYIGIAVNFTSARPQAFSTNLQVELYSE